MNEPWLNKYKILINWLKKSHFVRKYKIKKYLQKHPTSRLQIAPGELPTTKPSWLTADLYTGDIYLNARKKLPFPDNSIDYIFSEHFLEHLHYKEAIKLLAELYRITKTEGIIRISVPDLEKMSKIYLTKDREYLIKFFNLLKRITPKKYFEWAKNRTTLLPAEYININFYTFDHLYAWDSELLRQNLLSLGFKNIKFYKPRQSANKELKNIERHGQMDPLDKELSKDTLCIEATKPKKEQKNKVEITPSVLYFLKH